MILLWIRHAAIAALALVLALGGGVPSPTVVDWGTHHLAAAASAEMPDCPDCALGGAGERNGACLGLCAGETTALLPEALAPERRNGARLALSIDHPTRGAAGIPDPRPPAFARS